jgi:threonine dehydratase
MMIIDSPHRLSLPNIEHAATQIDPVFRDSPQFECEPLSQVLGATLTLKVETLNRLRSFKGRGADFFMHEHAARLAGRVLVCATAGVVGIAAVLEHAALRTQRLAPVLCGANLTGEQVARWLT